MPRRRILKRASALAVLFVLVLVAFNLPQVMAAFHICPPLKRGEFAHDLVFVRDGAFNGNDDAKDKVLYDVQRWNGSRPGTVGVVYNSSTNVVHVSSSNLRAFAVSAKAVYADNAYIYAGINWLDDTNLYKSCFVEWNGGLLTVNVTVDTGTPNLQSLSLIDVPRPIWVRVNNADFLNYTYANGTVTSTKLPTFASYTVTISFVEERTPPPVAVAAANRTAIKRGDSVMFDGSASFAQGGKRLKQWYWDFGDGDYAIGKFSNHTYALPESATYKVILVVEDDEPAPNGGLLNSTDLLIDYNKGDFRAPVADAGPDIIVPEDFQFRLDGANSTDNVGIAQYVWLPGDGSVYLGAVADHAYNRSGRFTAVLEVRDLAGNDDTDSALVDVRNLPPVASAGPDLAGALNQSLIFDGTLSRDTSSDMATLDYIWDFGDGATGFGSVVKHGYSVEGTYDVTLTVRDNDGASAVDTTRVRIEDRPNLRPVIMPIKNVFVRLNYAWFLNLEPYIDDDNLSSLSLTTSSVYAQPSPNNLTRLALKFHYTDPGLKTEAVRIAVNDGQYDAATTLNVTILDDDWPPVATKKMQDRSFKEDETLKDAFNVKDFFADNDSATLTFTWVSPGHVFVDLSAGGSATLTATKDWFGTETIAIKAEDSHGAWVEDTFRVNVTPVNDAPFVVQEPQDANVAVGKELVILLASLFSDVDSPALQYSSSSPEVRIVNNGQYAIWKPTARDQVVEFTLTATDGEYQVTTRKIRFVAVAEGFDPLTVVAVAIAAIITMLGIALAYRNYRWRYELHEVFVITEAGLLAAHASSKQSKLVHEDLVAAMLTAIRKFVQESFGEDKEGERGLGRLDYEGFVIAVEQGKGFFVAVVATGADSPPLRRKMRESIKAVGEKWGDVLANWDGDESRLEGLEERLRELMEMPLVGARKKGTATRAEGPRDEKEEDESSGEGSDREPERDRDAVAHAENGETSEKESEHG